MTLAMTNATKITKFDSPLLLRRLESTSLGTAARSCSAPANRKPFRSLSIRGACASRVLLVIAAVVGVSCAAPAAWAGKYNPTRSIGDAAPDFKDLPGTDGKSHSLSEFVGREALVVVFTCNTCPTAVDYEARVKALAEKLGASGKVAVIAINSNQVADDQLPKMKERAEREKFNFAYLRDDTQQIAKAYGATVTPEFFVLDKQRRIAYMGALDDSTDPAGVKARYVEDAVAALLEGKSPAVSETVGRGCLVRYARERRKK